MAEASTSIYPAFAGGTAGLGPIRFGYSFFTSDHDNTDDSFRFQVPASGNVAAYTYSRRLLATGDMLYAGASASFSLGPNLALGLGQFYYRRTRQASLIESSVYTTGASFDSNIRQSTLNEGTVTTAGIMVRGAGFSWGLSARLPKRLADSTLVESSQTTYAGSAQDRAESSSKPHAFDEITPPEYTMGLAWQPSNWLLIATDYIHIPAEKSPHEDSDGVNTTQSRNWALGCELSGGPLALRGGIFTNNSLVNEPSPSKVDQPAWINFRGFSAGLGWRRKSSEAALGIVKQIGSGTDQSVSGSSALFSIEAESTTYLLTNRFTLP